MATVHLPLLRVLSRNVTAQIGTKLITSLSTMAMTYALTRAYGPHGYGEFAKVFVIAALLYAITDFGLNAVFIRSQDTDTASMRVGFGDVLVVRMGIGLGLVCLVFLLVGLLPYTGTTGYSQTVKFGILISTLTIPIQSLIVTTHAVFQKSFSYDRMFLATGTGWILMAAGVWIISNHYPDFDTALKVVSVMQVIGYGITGVLSYLLVPRAVRQSLSVDSRRIRYLVKSALPLGVTLLLNLAYVRTDILIMSVSLPANSVGIYAYAYRYFDVVLTVPTFLMNTLYPFMVRQSVSVKASRDRLTSLFSLYRYILPLSLVGTILTYLAAPLILFGQADMGDSVMVLRILAISIPVFFATSAAMWSVIAHGMQRILVPIYGTVFLVSLALNLYGIPRYGMTFAAVMTVVSEVFVLLFLLIGLARFHIHSA